MRTTLAVGLILALGAAAHAETFDVAQFQPPAGWKVERRPTVVMFTHVDEAKGTYAMLGLYSSTASRGTPEQDFAAEWVSTVKNGFSTGPAPVPTAGRTASGLSYLAGSADGTQGAVRSHLKLLVFRVGSRVVSVLESGSDVAALGARDEAITAFLDSLRLEGASSPPRAAAPPAAPSGKFSGLTVPTPEGWVRTETGNVMTLERVFDLGWGKKNVFRLVFTAPVPASGNAMAGFQAFWKSLASATFEAPIHPLPLRVRLKSGATLIYDGGEMRLRNEQGTPVTGFVYAVSQSGWVTGVLGVFTGWDASVDRALREIFDGLRFDAGAAKEPPLVQARELAGSWRASTTTLGNWVDAAGNYRGDASLATGETLTLRADGTFRSQFAAVGQGRTLRSDTSGPFSVEDDTLVLKAKSGEVTRYRITGLGRAADGKAGFLLLGVTRDDFPILSAGSAMPRAGDLYVGLRE